MVNLFIRYIALILLVYISFFSVNAQQSIRLDIQKNPFKKAYLVSLYGEDSERLDTTEVLGDSFVFDKLNLPTGLYRIEMNDTVSADIVVDGANEEIQLSTSFPGFIDRMKVIKSEDNKAYYSYIQYKIHAMQKVSAIDANIKKIQSSGSELKDNIQREQLLGKKDSIIYDIYSFTDKLIEKHKGRFVSKIIHSMLVPRFDLYKLKNPKDATFKTELDYLQVHFFDNIDFSDSAFLRTEVLYKSVKYYVERIASRSVQGMNKSCDFICNKAKANPNVYNYIVNLLIDVFEYTPFDGVFAHMIEYYYLQFPKDVKPIAFSARIDKLAAIQKTSLGALMPAIAAKDTLGKMVSLSSIKTKYVLVFFWSSECEHCEEAMPKVIGMYDLYKNKNFQIYSISMDTKEDSWKAAIRKNKMKFTTVSDLKGPGGPLSKQFNIIFTPQFFILDQNRKIISKPPNIDVLLKQINELMKNQ